MRVVDTSTKRSELLLVWEEPPCRPRPPVELAPQRKQRAGRAIATIGTRRDRPRPLTRRRGERRRSRGLYIPATPAMREKATGDAAGLWCRSFLGSFACCDACLQSLAVVWFGLVWLQLATLWRPLAKSLAIAGGCRWSRRGVCVERMRQSGEKES